MLFFSIFTPEGSNGFQKDFHEVLWNEVLYSLCLKSTDYLWTWSISWTASSDNCYGRWTVWGLLLCICKR